MIDIATIHLKGKIASTQSLHKHYSCALALATKNAGCKLILKAWQ